ncbi:hypothetical protein ACOSQ2_005921 [Xanthoceras sorbifolium]
MSTSQVLLVSDKSQVMRRTANFPANICGDRFVNYNSEEDKINHASKLQEIDELKEQVRREVRDIVNSPLTVQQLNFIDAIERLGVGYHFEAEIQQVLQHLYDIYNDHEYDLYYTALCFRLLRQNGHYVSCDKFNKFKDDEGNFKESLASDVLGMLSLYEAAHVGVHGEDILDEAIAFTTAHLQSMVTQLTNPQLAEQVIHDLRQPLQRGVPRVESRRYISVYQDEDSHNQALLKLAKLDFNLLQSLHKKELSEICRWWKNLDFSSKLPFARNRVVECYFWMLGMNHEPSYSLSRQIVAKSGYILTVVDDIYDTYGSPEELKLLTEMVERWDANCMDQLPEYMQFLYNALLDFSGEIEEETEKKGWSSHRVQYAREAMKIMFRANFEESKWLRDNRTPTMEEYLGTSLVTAGTATITALFYLCMDDTVTKEALDWVLSRPTIIKASDSTFRLMDDIKSHKFEQKRGHIASSVECYMKQYGVSEQEAYEELQKQVNNAWKDVNQESLKLAADLPKPILKFIVGYPRIIDLFYKDNDNFTHVGKDMKACIESLLIDPIPI